jgi:hypothetical protein
VTLRFSARRPLLSFIVRWLSGAGSMGVCLGLAFDKKFPNDDAWSKYTDGKFLLHGMDRFDEICNAKKVTLFSALAGPDEDEMEALAAELAEGETLEITWFTCADGIRTVKTLIDAMKSDKQWSKGFRKNEVRDFIEGLQKLEECLEVGKKKRARFYLLYY